MQGISVHVDPITVKVVQAVATVGDTPFRWDSLDSPQP